MANLLNDTISAEAPVVYSMLSDLGRRIYFPSKGILSQAAEAGKMAKKFNATIGTAKESGTAMNLPCVMEDLPGFSPNVLLYAPSPGVPALRQAWKNKVLHDNPSLAGVPVSSPVVTNGLSHALSLAGDMFINPGDKVLIPDLNWDNYLLNFQDRLQAELCYYPFFDGDHLNTAAFDKALQEIPAGEKVFIVLNFPNNPTGYTPVEEEGDALAASLIAAAERGVRVIALIDDAYYGLFYDSRCMTESLFCRIAGKHENLLAIKADAATKECYVWGLRVGFLTFAVAGAAEGCALYTALEQKVAGIIRSAISNCASLSQQIVAKALNSPDFYEQRAAKAAVMQKRCECVRRTLEAHPEYSRYFQAYPFNSGYFMCIRTLKTPAEELRRYLLTNYETGGIAMGEYNLRLAFSCLEEEQIPELFDTIYKALAEIEG
ncbi:MAG: aminotransferase class I/II-fold pyridoxal phosphate-dependent enzyme [Victivallales bacterium]|nr:aminotransferase class I/II-fold pyridoxal phosphate-dependent enzyme [Victivallales bacterium]